VLDWKLVDAPELGYTSRDQPFPRGELLVKTTTAIPGYYKNPKARRACPVLSCLVLLNY
jgi:fatty acid CoA ligase FadD9